MKEVEKLIAEARRWANGHHNRRSGEMVGELVEALEKALKASSGCSDHRLVQHRDGKPPWCRACGGGRPMSNVTPSAEAIRATLVYLSKYKARDQGDVDLAVVEGETVAQFDRMIAEVERKAAHHAWELGYDSGCGDSIGPTPFRTTATNPYWKESE